MKKTDIEKKEVELVGGNKIPTLVEFVKLHMPPLKLSDKQRERFEKILREQNMIDEQKLINELVKRSERCKGLAKQYKEAGEKEMSNGFDMKAFVYDEIKHDIEKGKFKLK